MEQPRITSMGSKMHYVAHSIISKTRQYAQMNLTSVGVTNGAPSSGTGTVSTLDAVLAVLPSALAANGGLKIEGVSGGVSVATTPASTSYTTTTTFTCGTTAYAANDGVGVGAGAAALDLGVLGPSAGIIEIVSASLEIDATALISGESSYRLYLYNVTPPSAINDSAAWTLPSGDRASFLGYVDLGTVVALAATTLYVRQDNIGCRVKLAGTHLFGYLVTNGAYTPTARVFLITLHTQAV